MILLFLVLLSACKGGKESSNITSGVPNNNNPTPSTSKNISEAPFVINAVPAQDAVDVGLGSGVKVTFSAPMDAKTITPNTFQLRLGNGVVPAMITIRRTVATLIPSSPLVAGKIYEATVKKIVKDTNGKSLEESYTWNFTTVPMARNLWHGIKQFGPAGEGDSQVSIAKDIDGNIFVTGTTIGNLDDDLHPNAGESDIFLAKYNSSGVKQWVKQIGTDSWDTGEGVAVAADGNIFVTGMTGGSLDDDRHPNVGDYDIFLAKYNSSGAKQWIKQIGTNGEDSGKGVAIDADGNIFMSGTTGGSLDDDHHPNAGHGDIFLA
ncbi:MAG: SBBP repeat-containing protein, partial [Deltaproteobacteria bacterium]|nr:SBBP repeat-containing protein [Deltaproteobacteria bacterium]